MRDAPVINSHHPRATKNRRIKQKFCSSAWGMRSSAADDLNLTAALDATPAALSLFRFLVRMWGHISGCSTCHWYNDSSGSLLDTCKRWRQIINIRVSRPEGRGPLRGRPRLGTEPVWSENWIFIFLYLYILYIKHIPSLTPSQSFTDTAPHPTLFLSDTQSYCQNRGGGGFP